MNTEAADVLLSCGPRFGDGDNDGYGNGNGNGNGHPGKTFSATLADGYEGIPQT